MRSTVCYHAVDSHTEGMPTRVITGGVGVLPGGTMSEKRQRFGAARHPQRTPRQCVPRRAPALCRPHHHPPPPRPPP
ncbi:proline racemase family protein, partial [Streptomyces sp. NPDC059515]|uniref:proline racemase family protein n=1 Tax=Streptomyces sp. NPDC059515 TaxID=3346854 RepID=UPI00368ACD0B